MKQGQNENTSKLVAFYFQSENQFLQKQKLSRLVAAPFQSSENNHDKHGRFFIDQCFNIRQWSRLIAEKKGEGKGTPAESKNLKRVTYCVKPIQEKI